MKKSIVYALLCVGILSMAHNINADADSELAELQASWNVLSEKKKFLHEMVTTFISQDWNDISQGKKEVSNVAYVPLKSFFDEYNSFSNACYDFYKKNREFSNGSTAFYKIVNEVIPFNNIMLFEVDQQLKTAASGQLFKKTAISGENGTIANAIDAWIFQIAQQTENWNKIGSAIESSK